jgi:hypothetical protein
MLAKPINTKINNSITIVFLFNTTKIQEKKIIFEFFFKKIKKVIIFVSLMNNKNKP